MAHVKLIPLVFEEREPHTCIIADTIGVKCILILKHNRL